MANKLRTVIKRSQAVAYFNANVLPFIQAQYEKDGIKDLPARRKAWDNWTDHLCKDTAISDWQYAHWTHPSTCE